MCGNNRAHIIDYKKLNNPNLTIKESFRLWHSFAKTSFKHAIALAVILSYYSTMAVLTWPVFIISSIYFFYKMSTGNNYVLKMSTYPTNNQILRLLQHNLFIEPRCRAFVIARSLRKAITSKSAKQGKYALFKQKAKAYSFFWLTSIPFFYAKHVNLWCIIFKDGFPSNNEQMTQCVESYIYAEF